MRSETKVYQCSEQTQVESSDRIMHLTHLKPVVVVDVDG